MKKGATQGVLPAEVAAACGLLVAAEHLPILRTRRTKIMMRRTIDTKYIQIY
jgi:hypothetical protein